MSTEYLYIETRGQESTTGTERFQFDGLIHKLALSHESFSLGTG